MARRLTADVPRRARLRLQVEHGLDARHARATSQTIPIHRRFHQHDAHVLARSTRSPRTSSCRSRTTRSCTASGRCSTRCPATAGRSSPTCARSTPTCGRTRARSSSSWAASSASGQEWNAEGSLDWHLLDDAEHAGVQRSCATSTASTASSPALWELDFDPAGFRWIERERRRRTTSSRSARVGDGDAPPLVCVCNLSPVPRDDYRVGLPRGWPLARGAQHRRGRLRRQRRRQPRRRRGGGECRGTSSRSRRS